jgi:YHS domain-containing protein
MKTRLLCVVAIAAVAIAFSSLYAADKPGPDVKCPVSGKAVNPEATADFNGGKVYFCCNNCPKAFAANPDKYAAKANHQLAQTGQLKQTACPLAGKPTNPATEIDVQGVKVAFCCNNCKGKVAKASGDEQLELVFKSGKGFSAVK